MFAQAQADVQAAEGFGIVAKILQRFLLVAEGDLSAQLHKLPDALLVADTGADKGNFFAPDKLLQLFNGLHDDSSFGVWDRRQGRPLPGPDGLPWGGLAAGGKAAVRRALPHRLYTHPRAK